MSSDKKFHLCRLWRMSLEVYQGTGRRTTGKACILGLALVQGLQLEAVVELRKMVETMVRQSETESQGEVGEVVRSQSGRGNESSMV